jgi:hypothetical protein
MEHPIKEVSIYALLLATEDELVPVHSSTIPPCLSMEWPANKKCEQICRYRFFHVSTGKYTQRIPLHPSHSKRLNCPFSYCHSFTSTKKSIRTRKSLDWDGRNSGRLCRSIRRMSEYRHQLIIAPFSRVALVLVMCRISIVTVWSHSFFCQYQCKNAEFS